MIDKDFLYYAGLERRAREQAEASDDISTRIAHLAAAEGFAVQIESMRSTYRAGLLPRAATSSAGPPEQLKFMIGSIFDPRPEAPGNATATGKTP